MNLTKARYIPIDTDTSQLSIKVLDKYGRIPRPIANTDPAWMTVISHEVRRVVAYLRALGATRDIEVVFKTRPTLQAGWEIDFAGHAIRIEIFGYRQLEDGTISRRDDDYLRYLVRHELGHACHDIFHKQIANLWTPRIREHYSESFAIKMGTPIDMVFNDDYPLNTLRGKRYLYGVDAIIGSVYKFLINQAAACETQDSVLKSTYLKEVAAAKDELAAFIPESNRFMYYRILYMEALEKLHTTATSTTETLQWDTANDDNEDYPYGEEIL